MDVKGLQAGSHNTQINHYAAASPPLAWPLLVGRAPLRADAFQSRGALVAVASPVLVGAERVLGPDHPDTPDTRRNLAHWRGLAGDPGPAFESLDAVLADYVRVLGADHPDTMQVRENLVHWRPQDLEALLADRTRVLGADHPHTVRTRRMRRKTSKD